MSEAQEKILESIISGYLNSVYTEMPPTEDEFNEGADLMRTANMQIAPVSDKAFENMKKRLRAYITVRMDSGCCLPDPDNGHQSWLPARRSEIDFFYWERYRRYLTEIKHWNPRVVSKLGQISDEILDQCGDPKGKDFRVKGLILGDVQSGKTANYTALANKAADVGYELIIVLAGIPELLRQQTQKRLDEELCGRQSNLYLDPSAQNKYKPVGVGRYSDKKKVVSFTSEASDFNAAVLKSNNLALDTVNCPILLVVKKNKTILNNLFRWLKTNNSLNSNGKINKSLFLIDDEADNASINTNNPDEDPTAINDAVRKLSLLFSKSTYVAVTATPFANIFINSDEYEDLFPSDFIYALEAPSNYIGADKIFSDEEDDEFAFYRNMLVRIDEESLLSIFPEKHKKNLVVEELPDDLYEAGYYFILANAIRDIRNDVKQHRSMMIHVSRFINVQRQVADLMQLWLDQVRSDLRNYSQLPAYKAEDIENISELHAVWNKFGLSRISGISWEKVLKDYLYKAAAPIEVRAVNGETGSDSLDYDRHKEDGLRVIAVGGNTLSRGLTLEGLMVTYFYRNTYMYDTLMQMGRWFGYRPNYEDLVKVWLSQEEIDWFGQIKDAEQDLRDQIFKMKQARCRPIDFGLKVKEDPNSLLTVTASNKMKNTKFVNVPISVSGYLLETPRLSASLNVLKDNASAFEKFIEKLDIVGTPVPETVYRTRGQYFWENVSGGYISEFLRNFQTYPWHLNYNGPALADYIADHVSEWKNGWDVVLINNGTGPAFERQLKCGERMLSLSHTEKRNIIVSFDRLSVSGTKLKVGAGGAARIGLTEDQYQKAKVEYFAAHPEKKGKRTNLPDYAYMIEGRNPILMLHVLEAVYDTKAEVYPKFLYAIGVGFPGNIKSHETATYRVNQVELKSMMNFEEFDE